MDAPTAPALTRWSALWHCEWLRLREDDQPGNDGAAELARLRGLPGGLEARLHARALARLAAAGLATARPPRPRTLLGLLLLLAVLIGASSGYALLGDGLRPVNVLWVAGALVLPSLATLLLWLFSLRWQGPTWAGRGVLALWRRWPQAWPDPRAAQAAWDLLAAGPAGRWLMAASSHGLWCGFLLGAALGLLLSLSLRRYGFVWETTILPAEAFATAVAAIGAVPGSLGFPQPAAEAVLASGGGPLDDAAVRRAWSGWLLGVLLVYGLLPRLLALLVSLQRLRRAWRRLALPLQRPYYRELAARLSPPSRRSGVVDAAPQRLDDDGLRLASAAHGSGRALLGLELGDWPPFGVETARDLGVVDRGEERDAALAALVAAPVSRLLVVLDGDASPDRGNRRLLVALSRQAMELAVLLLGSGRQAASWRSALDELGLPPQHAFAGTAQARAWLQQGST